MEAKTKSEKCPIEPEVPIVKKTGNLDLETGFASHKEMLREDTSTASGDPSEPEVSISQSDSTGFEDRY